MVYHKHNPRRGKRPGKRRHWIPAAALVVSILRLLLDARSLM